MFIFSKGIVFAYDNPSRSSAILASSEVKNDDIRVKKLRAFLRDSNSPMADSAQVFVEKADEYHLDWKLLAAISGVESCYGQAIPPGSYNAWGWGIYANHVTYFTSWNDGISTISQGLRENYINKLGTDDVHSVGSIYAASPTWAQRVIGNMSTIDNYTSLDPSESLSISL